MKRLIPFLILTGGAALCGCGGSENNPVAPAPSQQAAPPIARADAYSTTSGASLSVPALTGVLANDTLNSPSVTVNYPSLSTQGGQIALGDDSGAFVYSPAQGFLGVDNFQYEVSNIYGTSRAIVTVTVTLADSGPGIVVDSTTGSDATGDADTGSPFATVQAAAAAAGPGVDIVVYPGRGTYTGTVNLQNGQRLLGFASTSVRAQGSQRPTFSGPVVLADGNTVDAIRVTHSDGIAIDGDDQNSGVVTNCEIVNTLNGGTGIQIRDITGDWRIENNKVQAGSGIGIDMDTQDSGVAVIRVNNNTVTDCKLFGLGMAAIGQSNLKVQANGNVLTGNLGPASLFAIASGTSTLTMQIQGNQNDKIYRFERPTPQTTMNVERFSEFQSLNTGTVVVPLLPVTDVPAGFAGF